MKLMHTVHLVFRDPATDRILVRMNNRDGEAYVAPKGLLLEQLPEVTEHLPEQNILRSAAEELSAKLGGVTVRVLEVPYQTCWQYAGVARPCTPLCMSFRWSNKDKKAECALIEDRGQTNRILDRLVHMTLPEFREQLKGALGRISIGTGFR